MRPLLLTCLLAASAFAQGENLGPFTNSGDVGNPAKKGSTVFDALTGQFRITGSGANIWAKDDQFQYVWKEISGNFAVTATMQFLGQGADHRKAGIMLRQSLDADSAYGDIVIHGNGMPGIQWRSNKGENTSAFDLPFDGPGKFTLKLVRNGVGLSVSIAKDGAPLKDVARTEVTLRNPILVGLAVSSGRIGDGGVFRCVGGTTGAAGRQETIAGRPLVSSWRDIFSAPVCFISCPVGAVRTHRRLRRLPRWFPGG